MEKLSHSSLLSSDQFSGMRRLVQKFGLGYSVADFEEWIVLPEIRNKVRLWFHADRGLIGFAFVDDFNNLIFALDPECDRERIGAEMVAWGMTCLRSQIRTASSPVTLDLSCEIQEIKALNFILRHGFYQQKDRTFRYERDLSQPIQEFSLPGGFVIRQVEGESEAGQLAALHRAAFGTEHMTVDYRLAMMRSSTYDPKLDLVIQAPDSSYVGFCVCSMEEKNDRTRSQKLGFTDPVGVHPDYQRQGFGKAILTAGLKKLRLKGAETAQLGTSSTNIAMQRLAEATDFRIVSEKLWFSKET